MEIIQWSPTLETGIDVIDQQHKRIVDYINAVGAAQEKDDRGEVGKTLVDLIAYTQAHFSFEEALMEDAGYDQIHVHKLTHQLFFGRVVLLQERFISGENVTQDLYDMLMGWLIDHIKGEDQDYVAAVKEKMVGVVADQKRRNSLLARFFGA